MHWTVHRINNQPAEDVVTFFVLLPVAVFVVEPALLADHHAQDRMAEHALRGSDHAGELAGRNDSVKQRQSVSDCK